MRSFGVSNMRLALSKNKIMPPIMKNVEVISVIVGSIP